MGTRIIHDVDTLADSTAAEALRELSDEDMPGRYQIGGDAFPTYNDDGGTPGLSALDYMAAAALTGLTAEDEWDPGAVAKVAYTIAEAMLDERDKRNKIK